MIAQEVIIKKRNLNQLSKEDFEFFVKGVINGEISDKQAVAFLMACFINGLNPLEITYLTQIMTDTGFKFQFPENGRPRIDKHSTGGIGDKVSLILLPILIDLGISVPMISGRGLGHTGGTLDKLESIIGLSTSINEENAYELFKENNGFIISQTKNIAPADKIFYSLRDECGIVDNIGLIVSSILSKKLAEDIQGLVMDIKVGNGAFMTNLKMAQELGDRFKDYSNFAKFPLTIIYSDMNQPLGRFAGNWLEIFETIECLKGNFHDNRIKEVTFENIIQCINLTDFDWTRDETFSKIIDSINSGRALEIFNKIIKSQGGDLEKSIEFYRDTPFITLNSMDSGFLEYDTTQIGLAIYELAYQNNPNNKIDYSAGIEFLKYTGDYINIGEPILKIYAQNIEKSKSILDRINNALSFKSDKFETGNAILKIE